MARFDCQGGAGPGRLSVDVPEFGSRKLGRGSVVSAPPPPWYVVTGAPSAGKSTVLGILASRGYATCPEVARTLIDRGLESGVPLEEIRGDERRFQDLVLQEKLELEGRLDPRAAFLLDRGMHDSVAYYMHLGYQMTTDQMGAVKKARYRRVFLVTLLESSFSRDYSRTESRSDAMELERLLERVYREAGFEITRIGPGTRQGRADEIESTLTRDGIRPGPQTLNHAD